MIISGLRKLIVAAAIISLVGASTSAIAASNAPIASPAPTAAGSWSTLAVMTGSSAATTAVAQRDDCDDHDDRDDRCGGFWHPPFLSLAVILATIATAIYILLKDDDNDLDTNPISPIPVSPN